MQYVNTKVRRDINTVYVVAVPSWEVPVLEFIFGDDGNVETLDSFVKVTHSDYPEAGAEYDRLVRKYGADPSNGIPYVASVYGNSRAGIAALKKAMQAAKEAELEAEAEAKAAAPAAPRKRGRRAASAGADLLA